jgi:hypothetical protein
MEAGTIEKRAAILLAAPQAQNTHLDTYEGGAPWALQDKAAQPTQVQRPAQSPRKQCQAALGDWVLGVGVLCAPMGGGGLSPKRLCI